jgi:hypothetical protein
MRAPKSGIVGSRVLVTCRGSGTGSFHSSRYVIGNGVRMREIAGLCKQLQTTFLKFWQTVLYIGYVIKSMKCNNSTYIDLHLTSGMGNKNT